MSLQAWEVAIAIKAKDFKPAPPSPVLLQYCGIILGDSEFSQRSIVANQLMQNAPGDLVQTFIRLGWPLAKR